MITRYVNTASTAGGNGTTNDTAGANRAYASLFEAEAALHSLNASDNLEVLCSGATADTTAVTFISGTYVGASYTMYIKVSPNHGGKWNTGRYRLENSTAAYAIHIQNSQCAIEFNGIQIEQITNNFHTVYLSGGAQYTYFKKCLFKGHASTAAESGIWQNSGSPVKVENCVFVGTNSSYGRGIYSTGTTKVYNSVFCNLAYPTWRGGGGGTTIKNSSIAMGGASIFDGNTIDYCATPTGQGTHPLTVSNWAAQLYNASYIADVDFSLKATSTLLNAGVGPSSDADVPTTDILSYARSGTISTIGPFEHYSGWIDPTGRNTKLDARFLKLATNPGLEDDGIHALRVKVGSGLLLDSTGISIDRSVISEFQIQEYTITASDVTGKKFIFSPATASTNQMSLTVLGGPKQNMGADYTCTDSTTVSWNGLSLDGFIVENDEVLIQYPS